MYLLNYLFDNNDSERILIDIWMKEYDKQMNKTFKNIYF